MSLIPLILTKQICQHNKSIDIFCIQRTRFYKFVITYWDTYIETRDENMINLDGAIFDQNIHIFYQNVITCRFLYQSDYHKKILM